MMIYKLAGEAFPDIKIPELTAFYEELEKWSDIFEGRPKWRRVKRSGGLVRGTESMVNMLNTGKILCDEETARQKAVSSCIREFADKGIPAFVDKAGREWSPEAYINMDIRTTVSNTANAAQDAVCDRYGVDLIEVSSHMGARPKCAHDQGKIFSRSNQSGIAHDGNGREIRYEPLSSTSYGQPDGLFGINCRHQKYPFVDGVNFQTYFPYDETENAKRYKEFQTQRAMERDIRKKKRECMMLEETGDAEALKAARADLRQSKKAYNAYSDEHGLRTREDRLRVERSSGKGAADQSSAKPVLPGGSGGHAVEIGVSGYDNGGKMASTYSNDWSKTVPQTHSKAELDEISAYAKERGIKLYQPQTFDGDIEMLKRQIDTISSVKTEYNITHKITLEFANMADDDFAETINNTIRFNNKAMRNAAITNLNLNSDRQLAATDFTGIAVHEMGHIISAKYGEKGLDIAHKAYYNMFKENISRTDLLDYLYNDVSEYSIFVPYERQSRNVKLKEITPEVLSKSKSTNSNDFSKEFVKLLKEAMNNEKI